MQRQHSAGTRISLIFRHRVVVLVAGTVSLFFGSNALGQTPEDKEQKSILQLTSKDNSPPTVPTEYRSQAKLTNVIHLGGQSDDGNENVEPAKPNVSLQSSSSASDQDRIDKEADSDGTYTSWKGKDDPQSQGFAPPRPPSSLLSQSDSAPPLKPSDRQDVPVVRPSSFPPLSKSEVERLNSLPPSGNSLPPSDSLLRQSPQPQVGSQRRSAQTEPLTSPRNFQAPIQPGASMNLGDSSLPPQRSVLETKTSPMVDAQVSPASYPPQQSGGPIRSRSGIAAPTGMPQIPRRLPLINSNSLAMNRGVPSQNSAQSKQEMRKAMIEALGPARQLVNRFDLENHTTVPGTPVSLFEMLSQPIAIQQRDSLIHQYWETYYDWAALVVAQEHQAWAQSLPTNVSAAEQLMVQAEQRLAQDRLLAAQIQMGKSQSRLLDFFVNSRADDFLPLPNDRPTIFPYDTHYEQERKRRTLPSSLRGIDQMLDGTNRLIAMRANTVNAARQARSQLLAAVPARQTTLASVIQAGELCRVAELDLVASVVNYNQAIGNYMATAFPSTPAESLVTSLLGSSWKTRAQNRQASRVQNTTDWVRNASQNPLNSQGGFQSLPTQNGFTNGVQSPLANQAGVSPPRIEDVLPIRSQGGALGSQGRIAGGGGVIRNDLRNGGALSDQGMPRGNSVADRAPSIQPQRPLVPQERIARNDLINGRSGSASQPQSNSLPGGRPSFVPPGQRRTGGFDNGFQ